LAAVRLRVLALIAVATAAFAPAAHAGTFTRQDGAETMDDATTIATSVYIPDGEPPTAGWPGVILVHGLGGSREDTNQIAEKFFAPYGYAVMTYDIRGHGNSGGYVTFAGPREIADLRALERRFAQRPDVDDNKIGAWGISYGAGEVWEAAAQGVPFKAIDVVQTWSDLFSALYWNGVPKSGLIAGLLGAIPAGRLSPTLSWLAAPSLSQVEAFAGQRSVAGSLNTFKTPVLMVQGRRDFLFGNDQGIAAFQRLKVPKLLYFGDNGHAPSSFPAADTNYSMTLSRAWLDHFVKGDDNGVDEEPRIQIAPDRWTGKPAEFPALPATHPLSFALVGGPKRIGWAGRVIRPAGRARAKIESFGSPVVTVRATTTAGWDRLVAVLTATTPAGKQIAVSTGAVPTRPGTRTYTFPLLSQIALIPADSQLQVTFASSTAGTPADPVYLQTPPAGSPMLTVTEGVVRLSAMIRPVS
jgi:predicted acyl esterase